MVAVNSVEQAVDQHAQQSVNKQAQHNYKCTTCEFSTRALHTPDTERRADIHSHDIINVEACPCCPNYVLMDCGTPQTSIHKVLCGHKAMDLRNPARSVDLCFV